MFAKAWKPDHNSKEHKALTRSVAVCLVKDVLPLSRVRKVGFKAMVHKLNDLPSRNYFSCVAIPALYCETRTSIE